MQQHKMYRRMIVIFHIKINRQIIKGIVTVHGHIIPELLRRDPYRFLIDIRFIRQKLTVPPVLKHILYRVRQIRHRLRETVSLNFLPHELRQSSLRLCGYDPGIVSGIGQLKA